MSRVALEKVEENLREPKLLITNQAQKGLLMTDENFLYFQKISNIF
jgi:hypothetical protein